MVHLGGDERVTKIGVIKSTSQGYRQFYEFLRVDWVKIFTYSLNMLIPTSLKARELPW